MLKALRKKLWALLATLALLPGLLVAPAAGVVTATTPYQIFPVADQRAILQSRFVDYDLASGNPISVIVELEGFPLAIIEENLREQGVAVTPIMEANHLQNIAAEQRTALAAIQAAGLTVSVQHHYRVVFNGMAMQIPANQVERLADIPGVISVHPDIEMRATGLDVSLPVIGAPPTWALPPGITGRGILVAVLDTGADYMHPDLGGGIGPGFKVIGGTDFVDDDNDPMEQKNMPGTAPWGSAWNTSHGTHVAATMAAVAPDARIYKIRVLGPGGSGSSSDVMAGIERAVHVGAHVANMSLGAPLGHPDSPWARAVDNGVRAGVVFTVSAGNSGIAERTTGTYANTRLGIAVGWADTTPKPLVLPRGATTPMVGSLMTFSPPLTALEGREIEFVSVGLGNVPADFRDGTGASLVTGRIALMERGGAPFATKSRNARDAGAIGAIVFNNVAGSFGGTLGTSEPGDIPTLSLSQADGHALRAMAAGSRFVTLSTGTHHLMSPSSSRGPSALLDILPHVSAPGQAITAAYPFPGTDGSHVPGAFQRVPGGPWFGTISGTSMAAPHVAGAAALMLQKSPQLTPENIRLALMNTAADIKNIDGRSFRPVDQGAGMINVFRAATARLRIAPGMLNFREVALGETQTMLRLESLRTSAAVFRTRVEKFNPAHQYEIVLPRQVTIGAGAQVNVQVSLLVDAALPLSVDGISDYTGYAIFENVADPTDSYRVPFHFVNSQVVSQVTVTPDAFSPNVDGVQDTTTISFVVGRPVHAVAITAVGWTGASGFHVPILITGPLSPGSYTFVWDGTFPPSVPVHELRDGFNQIHVRWQLVPGGTWAPAFSAGGQISPAFARLTVDRLRPEFHNVTPVIVPGAPGRIRIRGNVDDLMIRVLMSDGGSVLVNEERQVIRSQNDPRFPGWDWVAFDSSPLPADLTAGTVVSLRARDNAGNETVLPFTATGLTVDNPVTAVVAASSVRVQGTVAHGMTLTINGTPATYDSLGRFDVVRPLVPGTNNFTVVASVPAWGAALAPISREFTVVSTISVTGVSVTPVARTLRIGDTVQLIATVSPPDAVNRAVTWATSDPLVATVSAGGLVTAVGLGSANITATTVDGGLAAPAAILVVTTPVDGVSISPLTPHVVIGRTLQMRATTSPPDATKQTVTWASSNPEIATITATGLVTARAFGVTTISATSVDGGFVASTTLTVTPVVPVTGVLLTPSAHTLAVGSGAQLVPTILPASASNRDVMWVSSNPGVVTVDAAGVITALRAGSAHIMVMTVDGRRTAFAAVTVTPAPAIVSVTGVVVTPTTATLPVSGTVQLAATVSPANATNPAVNWVSSNPAVAAVSTTGVVTALAVGSAQITATTVDGGQTAIASVTVIAPPPVVPVTGVTVMPTTGSIEVGSALQLTATIAPANATNRAVTWSTNNPAVATVSADGLVSGVSAGTAVITARTVDGGHTATATITVTAPAAFVPVTGVTLTPSAHTLAAGSTVQLVATVMPLNATNQAVVWVSTNPGVAAVNAAGVVTALRAGSAHIMVMTVEGRRTAWAVVTVTPAVTGPLTGD